MAGRAATPAGPGGLPGEGAAQASSGTRPSVTQTQSAVRATQPCPPGHPGSLVCLPRPAAPAGARRARAGRHIPGDPVLIRALPSRSAARTHCQHPSHPSHKTREQRPRGCQGDSASRRQAGPRSRPAVPSRGRPSRPPAPPQTHRARARPPVLASAGTGGLSPSILGFTSSYASSKVPGGMFSKGPQAGTWYALDSPGLP